jgi:[acyl-carrier-protein] S-malonyltransferase
MGKKIAVLFPGQGAQEVGMGRDLFAKDPFADGLITAASDAAGVDLKKLCVKGPARLLDETANLQPALTALSLGLWHLFDREEVTPVAVAGHSLGELPALVAGGMADPLTVIALAARRGALMSRAAAKTPGGMIAITGLDREAVFNTVEHMGEKGVVGIAAVNAPSQVTVSGDPELLQQTGKALEKMPGAKVTKLRVSGAWHSRHMVPAVESFKREVNGLRLKETKTPMLFNRHGREAPLAEVPELIAMQLVRPVRWDLVMARSVELGITDFIEIGPGKVLRGLVRLNCPDATVRVHNVSDRRSLERTLKVVL